MSFFFNGSQQEAVTACETLTLLQTKFPNRLTTEILQSNPIRIFLGQFKEEDLCKKFSTISELKVNIRRAFAANALLKNRIYMTRYGKLY